MARQALVTRRCNHSDCDRVETTYAPRGGRTRAARLDLERFWKEVREWKCSRHRNPDRTLNADNTETRAVVVAGKSDGCGDRLFWGHSGIIHGPGFVAHADDFPEGTRLVVTARIEAPE